MNLRPRRLLVIVSLFAAILLAPLQAQKDRTLVTPPNLTSEIKLLVRLLEEAHYNKEAVQPDSYREIIPNYMSDLDGLRLFFLEGDRQQFEKRFNEGLYWNISSVGKIDAAYEIFTVYESRVQARITWIFDRLNGEFDLTTQETFGINRSDKDPKIWPADDAAADDLWQRRLKFELIQEMLNKKPLDEAKVTIRKRYERMLKNLAEIETEELAEMFLANVAKLYDPHSTYFSADTFEDFSIQMRLQLVGIGALLGLDEDLCVIKEIITGGPADLDKRLKPNDKIIAVTQMTGDPEKDEPVEIIGMKLTKIVDMIRGQKGTQVKLLVQPAEAADGSVRTEIVLTRNVVNLDSARARGAIFEVPDPSGNIRPLGVITLPTFYGPDGGSDNREQNSATKDVAKLVSQMKEAGVDGIVLDLRNNGGGLLSEAIELTGLFIPKGPVVQVRNYYGDVKIDNDADPDVAYEGPLAVLVSRFSASASEIVAGALQNYGRAVVVGDSSTHGKGTVQTIVEMRSLNPALARGGQKSGATKLTIQKFYLPNGSSTQLNGVVPDIVLPSIEDLLPIGEKDLPHALVWDEIPTSFFDGKALDNRVLTPLREASLARQAQLEEFAYLRKSIDWFKSRQQMREISLNFDERVRQKESDSLFRKEMKAERDRLTASTFTFREFHLGNPPAPKPNPTPVDGEEDELSTNEPAGYAGLDIHLRETLRVLSDALDLSRSPQFASEPAPLTAMVQKKG
ncbi:carboxy terminal-processing peptidase [Opitutaceae bacterium]